MLKITILDSASELRFRLEGKLSGPWVSELRQCWQTAASTTSGRATIADLAEIDFVDPAGQQLLSDMYRAGVRLQAATPLIRTLVDEICRPRLSNTA
jgi:ABC-type transporter Mla MlaB component